MRMLALFLALAALAGHAYLTLKDVDLDTYLKEKFATIEPEPLSAHDSYLAEKRAEKVSALRELSREAAQMREEIVAVQEKVKAWTHRMSKTSVGSDGLKYAQVLLVQADAELAVEMSKLDAELTNFANADYVDKHWGITDSAYSTIGNAKIFIKVANSAVIAAESHLSVYGE